MLLEECINKDYVQAMKARETDKSAALNYLRAMIKQVKVDKRLDQVADEEVLSVIKKQIKQRQDSIEQFEKGGRPELAEKERSEITIMKVYLPQELPLEQIKALITEAIRETGASSAKDMGTVMKLAREKVAGRADGKILSELVKETLSSF